MRKILFAVLAIMMVLGTVVGCTPAPATTTEPATEAAASTETTVTGDSNNDDLVGVGLGDDLGFGPVGYDMATLVERMGDKAHDSLISIQMQQMNEPWNQMWYETMKMLGDKYDLNLQFNNADNDVNAEAAQMDSAVNMGAAGIILFYIDPTSCLPAIDKAVDAGVPVIPCFPAPGSKAPVTIGDSEIDRGEFVMQQVLKEFEGKDMTVVIANIPAQYGILDDRVLGYELALSKATKEGNNGGTVTYLKDSNILELEADQWTQGVVDLLAANESVNCIVAAYGAPALYCAAGVQQTGKDVKVYGIDADINMCQKIKDGEITGLFPYDAKSNAYMCLFSMLRLVNGDQNVPDFSYAPQYATMWLTKDNVEDYATKQWGKTLS